MSAGGLSYDCLTTSRKATLPSVEMWSTNMNILRDPPAAKFTRRKTKVGDTQQVLLAQEDSGNRIAEYINVYARGVNPMVSVSYDNYGNNGGQRPNHIGKGVGVKLPYRPEVFRPPILRQEDLMPLSRQPREWFYALTNPSIPQIIQEMKCPDGKSSVHKQSPPPKSIITPIQYQPSSTCNNETCSIQKNIHPHLETKSSIATPCMPDAAMVLDAAPVSSAKIQNNVLHCTTPPSVTSKPSPASLHTILETINPKNIDKNRRIFQSITNKKGKYTKNIFSENNRVLPRKTLHSNVKTPILIGGDHTNHTNPEQLREVRANRLAPQQSIPISKSKEVMHLDFDSSPSEASANRIFPSVQTSISGLKNKTLLSENVHPLPQRKLPMVETSIEKPFYQKAVPFYQHEQEVNKAIHPDKIHYQLDSNVSYLSKNNDYNPVPKTRDVLHINHESTRIKEGSIHQPEYVSQNEPKLPHYQMQTQKTSYNVEAMPPQTVQMNNDNRRTYSIETSSKMVPTSSFYDIQSTSMKTNGMGSVGSFDPRQQGVVQRNLNEHPIQNRYTELKDKVNQEYNDRFTS